MGIESAFLGRADLDVPQYLSLQGEKKGAGPCHVVSRRLGDSARGSGGGRGCSKGQRQGPEQYLHDRWDWGHLHV